MSSLLTRLSARTTWVAAGLISWLAVAIAVWSQHRFDLQPCPWCILQRMIFLLIGATCLIAAGLVRPVPARTRIATWGAGLAAALVAALGWAGAAAALYQNRVASHSSSCKLTLADRIITGSGLDAALPEVFEVRATCADAVATLAGVPVELWSLALFLALSVHALWRLRQPGARPV
ncbi:MAG: disulfide bond formation protein B [Leptothrix sp. (in: b-proteobacteria)]